MRITLHLDYVLRRTCDSRWVGWHPMTGFSCTGETAETALWLIRDCLRTWVTCQIFEGVHPQRGFRERSDDVEWPAYQEYLDRFKDSPGSDDDWNPPERWSHTHRGKNLPDYVDTAFVHCVMDVETFGQECLIHDPWYGEIWYRNQGLREVTALVEMTYRIDERVDDVEAWVQEHYGHTVGKIVGIKPLG